MAGGSHKVVSKGYVNPENSQMASTGAIFTPTYHIKQLKPWQNSPASYVVNYSWLFACQREMELFEDHLSTHGCLTSHRKSSLGNFLHHYLAELLVNMYSYHVMVKNLSCCCVCGSWLFSNLVTSSYNEIFLFNATVKL